MKLKSLFTILACAMMLCSCGDSKSKLTEIAEAYAQISENQAKYAEGYRALYDLPRDKQEAELNALNAKAEKWKAENISLAQKVEQIVDVLIDTDFPCKATENSGITVKSAKFTTAKAKVSQNYNGMGGCSANFVITVEYEGTLAGNPKFSLMAGDNVVYNSPCGVSQDGKLTLNFRINLQNANQYVGVDAIRIECDGVAQNVNAGEETETAYQGNDDAKSVSNAGNGIAVGANLKAALESASNVIYEYNADSGIWAAIGNVAIVIDEDQLTQAGIDFIAAIPSDIAPNIAFKPEYVKPDAKILQIEAQ